jgi:acyl-CoA reductase-like NAD-dependent aldehyde dehydrogenase
VTPEPLEIRAPATGALLGTLAPVDLEAAAAAGRSAQPLWSLIPVSGRARYIRRAAVAMLDELDDLALQLADETGWPRAQLVLSELLPAVRGLRALATDGPGALGDRRLTPRTALLAGRSTRLMQSPVGVLGLRGPSASPWVEPALEAASALLAGNAVILAAGAPLSAQRLRGVFLRAGLPGELLAVVPAELVAADKDASGAVRDPLAAVCSRVVELARPARLGTLLVLDGAPRARVVDAALWAAFAAAGRHPAAAGRLVMVEGAVPGLVEALVEGAAQLRVGDPRDVDVDVGPLAHAGDLALLETAGAGARLRVAGFDGPFWTPTVIGGVAPGDALFRTPPPGPVLAVVETPDADRAVALAAREGRDGPISIWAQDAAKGERIARRLPSAATWVGRHGVVQTPVAVRLARHAVPRQLEWRAAWAPGTPRLPADPDVVASHATLAEARHGREARRWPALRAGAGALVRTARRARRER